MKSLGRTGTLVAVALMIGPATAQDPKDETARLVEKLGSESLVERDDAARRLEQLPIEMAERLEKWPTTDPEVRSRLDAVAGTIRLRVRLAKVFGPTRRASISSEARPLQDVAAELGRALGEKIVLRDAEARRPVTLKLSGATLWEALDGLADAADVRYACLADRVELRKGGRPAFPVKHLEQFRVGVHQATRSEVWTPSGVDRSGMVVVGIRFQRDLRPALGWFNEGIEIESVADAKGNPIEWKRRPGWAGALMVFGDDPFLVLDHVQVPPDAALPLTVAGGADFTFALEDREIELPMTAANKPHAAHGFEFRIENFANTEAGLAMAVVVKPLSEEAEEASEETIPSRMRPESAVVKTRDGSKLELRHRAGGHTIFEFETAAKVKEPVSVAFRWNTKLHRVQFPWRLEGVKIPE